MLGQPGPRLPPVFLDGSRRHLEDRADLLHGEPTEEPQLRHPLFPRIVLSKAVERLVEGEDIHSRITGSDGVLVEAHADLIASSLTSLRRAHVVDEEVA